MGSSDGGTNKGRCLKVELSCTIGGQQGASATERRATRGETIPLATRRAQSLPRISEEVHMQDFNASLESIMRECHLDASMAIKPLLPHNASP